MNPFVIPGIAVAFTVVFLIYRRAAIGKMDERYATYRAGQMAQRLGLQLVSGDPEFNLFIQQASSEVRRGPSDSRALHVQLHMQGSPHGVPMELVYTHRVEQESGFAEVTWTTWFDCRLVAHARQPFPPFEVVARHAPLGPIATVQALPPMATGDAQIDGTYAVSTHEPAMAQLLRQVLPGFDMFRNAGVHLVGDGRCVAFRMNRDKAPLLANALYFPEAMSMLMSDLARRVGG